jgi:two-component system response regulator HydG
MKQRANILVVDDSISLCKTMSSILKHNGYAVTSAIDGLEAIDRTRERPFDITFMDIKMPRMDGVEAYRRIKQIRPDWVVIMMTAYSDDDLLEQALQVGAYDILYKPLDMEEILMMVDEILARNRDRPE